ncbi:hypothetical protein L1987_09194 [Smallanthus sonchifolius]|uniref:Uncharacterized protein n=1 Tax=Smallanthus sonchifolius TaxID=185202 RepID=A0ACB9JMS4_9ASTR|nr:hypothetical protein L1987_09194 [Smallanthus sonchifolius]
MEKSDDVGHLLVWDWLLLWIGKVLEVELERFAIEYFLTSISLLQVVLDVGIGRHSHLVEMTSVKIRCDRA